MNRNKCARFVVDYLSKQVKQFPKHLVEDKSETVSEGLHFYCFPTQKDCDPPLTKRKHIVGLSLQICFSEKLGAKQNAAINEPKSFCLVLYACQWSSSFEIFDYGATGNFLSITRNRYNCAPQPNVKLSIYALARIVE